MARIISWMATIYVESYIRNEQSINKYKEALYYYRKAGKTRFEFDCLSQLAAHYRLKNQDSAKKYFANAILCILIISIPFVLSGIFSPDTVMHMMGADAGITQLGRTYTRIFL